MSEGKARVAEVWRYPFKGFGGQRLDECLIEEGKGLPYDRRWGVTGAGDASAVRADPYPSYEKFYVLKSNPETAKAQFSVDERAGFLQVRQGERAPAQIALGDPGLCGEVARLLSGLLQGEDIEVVDHGFSPIWDYQGALLSLVSLESIRSLSAEIGMDLDPRRFRGNVLFDGAAAWEEESWIGKDVRIGSGPTLRVVREIPRCRATRINPDTAEEDVRVPALLRKHHGHANMGVLAIPVSSGGPIRAGDAIL